MSRGISCDDEDNPTPVFYTTVTRIKTTIIRICYYIFCFDKHIWITTFYRLIFEKFEDNRVIEIFFLQVVYVLSFYFYIRF